MNEITKDILDKIPWCMQVTNDIVFVDETKEKWLIQLWTLET